MTIAVAHAERHEEKTIAVLDCIREYRPPFSPDEVVKKCAVVLKRYRLATVTGDSFAGAFAVEAFGKAGITLKISKQGKSQIYRDVLPMLNSKRVNGSYSTIRSSRSSCLTCDENKPGTRSR